MAINEAKTESDTHQIPEIKNEVNPKIANGSAP